MTTVRLTDIRYTLTAFLSDGMELPLEAAAENIAWEENEKELSVRLNITLRDATLKDGKTLSEKIPLCTEIYLYADWGEGTQEIFRGTVWEWSHSQMNNDSIVLTCYDKLYYLQKSKDSVYFSGGKKTKAIIRSILNKWDVDLGTWDGPDVTHKKILYKNKQISAMLTGVLDKAEDLGAPKCIIRAKEGKADVIKRAMNEQIWAFTASSNIIASEDKFSMMNLVTRVIITGKEDSNGRPKVEAKVDGKTEYGILQEIKAKGSKTLDAAKKAAKKILKERGKPTHTISIDAPDFPVIRKGDLVYIQTDKLNDFYVVKGISHNATNMTMSMDLEEEDEENQ